MNKIGLLGLVLSAGVSFSVSAATPAQKAVAAPAAVTTKTASGIEITTLVVGKGAAPQATDTVKVNYRGTLVNGQEFDSSYKRGQPATFPLNRVIPCWTEGVQKIKVGGKAKLVCPGSGADDNQGAPGLILPNASLIVGVASPAPVK